MDRAPWSRADPGGCVKVCAIQAQAELACKPPSVTLAKSYLLSHDLDGLALEVGTIITEHHKILPYAGEFAPSVEASPVTDVSLVAQLMRTRP